jgi:hypothetical protein
VEVIKIVNLIRIQIGLEFRKDLKNKKPFSFFYWPWAETPPPAQSGSASLPCAQPVQQPKGFPLHGLLQPTLAYSIPAHSPFTWQGPALPSQPDRPLQCMATPAHLATFIPVVSRRRPSSMEVLP